MDEVKARKEKFIQFSLDGIDFEELTNLFAEWQKTDKESDVWRYLMDKNSQLYFTEGNSIDYENLKSVVNDVYEQLDYIYMIVDEYLSS